MKEYQGRFPSATGQHVFYRVWKPDKKAEAVLQIMHGMAEHSERYRAFAEYLCKKGFIVAANDHPGHGITGKEAGKTGYFDEKDGWKKVITDLINFNKQLKISYNLPVYMMGHSMGSFFARFLMIRNPEIADKWILSGTKNFTFPERLGGFALANISLLFKDPEQKADLIHNIGLKAYNQKFKSENDEFSCLTSLESERKKYNDDPLCGFVSSNAFFRDLFYGINIIHKKRELKKMPDNLKVLIISGKEDPVGNFGKGVKKVIKRFEKHGLTPQIMLYNNTRHEILFDENKDFVYTDISDFLKR